MPRFPKAAVVGLLLIPLFAGAFVIQERSAQSGARLFDQVLSLVADRYVDSVDVGALYEKAARGLIAQLKDPYAELYTPKQVEMFNQNTGGFYAGTGMSIEDQHGNITVVKVFPHTPACGSRHHDGRPDRVRRHVQRAGARAGRRTRSRPT